MLVTHHHPDHVGGSMMGFELRACRAAGTGQRAGARQHPRGVVGVAGDRHPHERSDHTCTATRSPSAISRSSCCTPRATPGSQCFLLDGRLVAGDTLFLDGCGRTDFPAATSTRCTAACSSWPRCPGIRRCSPGTGIPIEPSAALSEVKRSNYVYKVSNLEQWHALMGG